MTHRSFLPLAILATLAAACGSAGGTDPGSSSAPTRSGDAIIGGTVASGYPEAVLIDMSKGGQLFAACSGSLIAPRVVLTAGHCVIGVDGWSVTAPYAGGQTAGSSSAKTLDYTSTTHFVDANAHDVGLVFLDAPITLSAYPEIASAPLADGAKAVNIGRIDNGTLSNTNLYVSPPVAVQNATNYGFPFDYVATDKIQSGDSGGPDMAYGTHTIVAVNSGGGSSNEVLARVDLVHAWITQEIASHGGAGGGGTPPGGGGGGGTPACGHDPCATGGTLKSSCDPCVATICSQDSYCCKNQWDDQCVGEVGTICGQACGG